MKKLLFITTSSLAANPRLVKEFETLKEHYHCFVICFKHKDWSLEPSEGIKQRNRDVNFIEIDRHSSIYQTLVSKFLHKAAIIFNGWFSKKLAVCAYASNDKSYQLYMETMALAKTHDFHRVIAHNLGAFYPALKVSRRYNVPLQLDIEDFYPGEAVYYNEGMEQQNRMNLMSISFGAADYITYASEGIYLECEKHFTVDSKTKKLVLINAFNASDFIEPKTNPSGTLKCVWFSQRIGPNRGLESVFQAAERLKHVEFHLIGNANQDFINSQSLGSNIKLHDSMTQEELHKFISHMDIGLALENPDVDPNRNICLTNKILAYFQAGCYILATNTFGQSHFLNSFDYHVGDMITSTLENAISSLEMNAFDASEKVERWKKAKMIAWDNEQVKLRHLFLT